MDNLAISRFEYILMRAMFAGDESVEVLHNLLNDIRDEAIYALGDAYGVEMEEHDSSGGIEEVVRIFQEKFAKK